MTVRRMKYWGWGFEDEAGPDDMKTKQQLADNLAKQHGADPITPITRPTVDEFNIGSPLK